MLKTKTSSEVILKSALVDWLLQTQNPSLIACEVPFADAKRRADVIQIQNNDLHGYEIKSASDNLDKLEGQLNDYLYCFSYLTIACDKTHLERVRKLMPKTVGIITFEKESVIQIRKPTVRKRLSKKMLLSFLNKQKLITIALPMGIRNAKQLSINDMRIKLCDRLSIEECYSIAKEYISIKHMASFNIFIGERGRKTTAEDIKILSGIDFKVRKSRL